MKKVLFALGFVLLVGACFISCKRDCYCTSYRLEFMDDPDRQPISDLNVGPATAKECAALEGVREVQIYTGTFHDSIVCHR